MRSRILLQTPDWRLGEFACAPGDPAWDEVNTNMGAWPHVVFPRSHVLIAQDGARPVLTTPNHVVFYKPHQLYRRGLRDPRGDRSMWLEVSPGAAGGGGRRAAGRPGRSVGRAHVPARGRARRAPVGRIGCWPRRRRCGCSRSRSAARSAGCAPNRGARGPAATHAELAEAAKELLVARVADPPALAELAAALYVSPFHLARVFRARTGFSLVGLRARPAAAARGRPARRRAGRRPLPPGARARLLLAEPLHRSLPRDVRPPAVGAARHATAHDHGSAPRRARHRTARMTWLTLAALGLALGAPGRRLRRARRDACSRRGTGSRAATSAGRCPSSTTSTATASPTSSPASRTPTRRPAITWVISGRTGRRLYPLRRRARRLPGRGARRRGRHGPRRRARHHQRRIRHQPARAARTCTRAAPAGCCTCGRARGRSTRSAARSRARATRTATASTT